MSTTELGITSHGVEETRDLARSVAAHLVPGDVVLLLGPLGSGKTTFARGVVEGLGHPRPGDVASPTFALHHRYEGGRLPVNHLDLYRLEGTAEMLRQGVLDPLEDTAAVTLVEWAERLEAPLENAVLAVVLAHVDPETRRIVLSGRGPRGAELVALIGS